MKRFKILLLLVLTLAFSCSDSDDEPIAITVAVSNFTKTIDENPEANTVLGVVDATTNRGNLTFSISQQVPANAMQINSTTGELMVSNSELFNFEINPTITGTVKVENEDVSETADIIITLTNVFEPKLLKQTTDQDGYWNKYFYNTNDELILITRTRNQISLDSTYLEYTDGKVSRVLNRIYVPVTGVVNSESVYTENTATTAKGSYKVFLDNGTVFQERTFEYVFSESLMKSIKFFNTDGSLSQEKTYIHDTNDNLTNWNQIWYNSDGSVQTNRESTFTQWDLAGLKTQSLLYWDYRIDEIPNIFISSGNILNQTVDGQTYTYTFEYDSDGNVLRYDDMTEQKHLIFEYYD